MRVDDLGVTTEPAGAGEPASAATQPIPVLTTTERCAQCAAALAPDQRYCLQCGEPRPHLGGPPRAVGQATEKSPPTPPQPPGFPAMAAPNARNNSLALIAGVGVLLLAMGVGVLIGRAGAGSAKAPPAQVISLGAGAGGTTTPTTTTPATTPTTETPAAASKKKKEAKVKQPAGSGSSITKPAPATVLKTLHKGENGQSYEQKSKNLPDVVTTG
jgi:hypothetical protein